MVRFSAFAALTLLFLESLAVPQQTIARQRSAAPTAVLSNSATGANVPILQVYTGNVFVPGSSGIANGTGSVDLGTAPVATVKPKVFTLRNAGTADLMLAGPIRLPRGFTLVKGFGTLKLAPGQTTTLVVALNSATVGRLSGTLSFGTNGSPGNRFAFTLTGTALGPPSMRIVDNRDPDFRTIGRWTAVADRGFQGTVHVAAPGCGTGQAIWTFRGLKPGLYQVSATWPAAGGQAANARFTLQNGTKTFPPVEVNQTLPPNDFRDAETTWQNLGGPCRLRGDTLTVTLSDRANGPVVADAVRIERLGYLGRIVAPGDPRFQTTGAWAPINNQVAQATRVGCTATWTFTSLVPGRYRVSTTWPANPQASASAPFTVLEGDRVAAHVPVNQQQAPAGLRDAGTTWADLGGLGNLFTVSGKTLVVRLTSSEGRGGPPDPVLAGPVRIERIYDSGSGSAGGPLISMPDVVRFLEQATWGPNDALVNHFLNDLNADPQAFLNEQYNTPISGYPMPPLVPDDFNSYCQGNANCFRDNYTLYPVQNRFFTNALYQPDQLHQRVAFALHQINIVSGYTDDQVPVPCRYVPYLQIFDKNAFGNYRDVLGQISLNPAMGHYLNVIYSSPPNPNENYAREVMQLFAVGLNFLNPDGTLQLDNNGLPIPTYTQDTVNNFAKVFTGFVYAPPQVLGVTNYVDPLVPRYPESQFHDQGPKTLLQYPNAVNPTLPAGQPAVVDVSQALDNIFYHPNVGPFVCSQLIQRLTTSNPSPGYVARVESWFEDDGTGVRGNLWPVVQAILLDPEARGDMAGDPAFGHLRDPALFACNVLRAFNATSYNGAGQSDGYVDPQLIPMGMDLFRAPTVFSYYPPNFNTPGYAPLLGPEFATLDSVSTLKRANFINQMTFNGGINVTNDSPQGTALNLAALQAMTPDAMADYLNGLLMHGTMSDAMRTALIQAINAVDATNTLKRARTAVYLVTTAAQYQIEQ